MLITYLTFVFLWTLYMGFENYVYVRPQSRPHFVGFLITHAVLAPISFVMSAAAGVLRDRVTAAYKAANKQKQDFHNKTGKKKLIG